jgi:hypothetical protein
MKDLTCPYCKHEFDVCHDDGFGYAESCRHEQECPECEKSFVFETSISFSYSEYKADCLNGAEHALKLSSTQPKEYSMMRCTECDYERKPTELENPL